MTYSVLLDRNSIEIFADGGLSNLSNLFFIDQSFDVLTFKSAKDVEVKNVKVNVIK